MLYWVVTYLFYLLPIVVAQYAPSPRWAQAAALLDNTLYVHGGLSDPFNSYSYTSAPEISDLLALDFSISFNASSPPWQLFSPNSSPALAWHTLSAFSSSDLLLFGGQPGPNSLSVLATLNDSSGLLSTSNKSGPTFLMEPQNWVNEPMRRIRHSASFANSKVWIIGGERADGSGNAFGEHYSFSPSGPGFVQLPSSSTGPPDIYGHASLVLPDGRLLVLGGYCASCSELVPMNMAWSLDTTQNDPAWEKLLISNGSMPSPRRDFAAVVLSSGQVLLQGGGDAQLQTTYSDGWMLDTSQTPMVWNSVGALSQLGERKDHLAVQAGGCVFFCFGYGSSSPAPASLFIYDPTTSAMTTSYNAPSPGSSPAITSLPLPSQTSPNPNSNGGTGAVPPVGSSGSPSDTSGSPSDSRNRVMAIALGTVFGAFGLVVGGLAIMYYMKRVHKRGKRASGRFFPLSDDSELPEEGSIGGAAVPEVAYLNGQIDESARGIGSPGVLKDILVHLGIDRFDRGPSQPRKDMFADEDARSFGPAGHSGTVRRQRSDGTSVWSLRSVSALVRGVMGREPGGSGADQEDRESDKVDHLREGDKEALIRQASLRSELSHLSLQEDESFWSLTDSFENPLPDDEYAEKGADYVYSTPISDEISTTLGSQDSVWPFSIRSRILTPLREASHASFSEPSNSLPSLRECLHGQITLGHAEDAAASPTTSISPAVHSPATSRLSDPHPPTTTSLSSPIGSSTVSRSLSASRPDSWWSRLTKSPLLDRRTSITSSKLLDFRDPTPAPPVCNGEDTKKACGDKADDAPPEHGRTVSSAHSGRTANTASAEHLGGQYDVVQRLPSDGSSLRRAPSLGSVEITERGMYAVNGHAPSEISLSSGSPHVDPPHSTSQAGPASPADAEAPICDAAPRQGGALVANRVKAYERGLSQELEPLHIAPPRNTRRREEVPSRTRPTIQYGVAPRTSLFIANPDHGHFS